MEIRAGRHVSRRPCRGRYVELDSESGYESALLEQRRVPRLAMESRVDRRKRGLITGRRDGRIALWRGPAVGVLFQVSRNTERRMVAATVARYRWRGRETLGLVMTRASSWGVRVAPSVAQEGRILPNCYGQYGGDKGSSEHVILALASIATIGPGRIHCGAPKTTSNPEWQKPDDWRLRNFSGRCRNCRSSQPSAKLPILVSQSRCTDQRQRLMGKWGAEHSLQWLKDLERGPHVDDDEPTIAVEMRRPDPED